MHNLFLGTAKHCLELWVKKDIIPRKDFLKMEEQMLHLHALTVQGDFHSKLEVVLQVLQLTSGETGLLGTLQ